MKAPFNRYVGLIILDVTMSNPNGDPDMESNPRMLEADNRGVISPVSFKRKLRDLVADESPVFESAKTALRLGIDGDNAYEILESRGRDRDKIKKWTKRSFKEVFGMLVYLEILS